MMQDFMNRGGTFTGPSPDVFRRGMSPFSGMGNPQANIARTLPNLPHNFMPPAIRRSPFSGMGDPSQMIGNMMNRGYGGGISGDMGMRRGIPSSRGQSPLNTQVMQPGRPNVLGDPTLARSAVGNTLGFLQGGSRPNMLWDPDGPGPMQDPDFMPPGWWKNFPGTGGKKPFVRQGNPTGPDMTPGILGGLNPTGPSMKFPGGQQDYWLPDDRSTTGQEAFDPHYKGRKPANDPYFQRGGGGYIGPDMFGSRQSMGTGPSPDLMQLLQTIGQGMPRGNPFNMPRFGQHPMRNPTQGGY